MCAFIFHKNGLWPFMVKTKAPLFKPRHLQEHINDLSTLKKKKHIYNFTFSLSFSRMHMHTFTSQHNNDRDHSIVKCLPSNWHIIIFFHDKITPGAAAFWSGWMTDIMWNFRTKKGGPESVTSQAGLCLWCTLHSVLLESGTTHGHCSKGQILLLCILNVSWAGVL